MDFWITGCARSGTTWLARTLNQASSHTVRHEGADAAKTSTPEYWQPFPVRRWLSADRHAAPFYGECHGKLRRYLSPHYVDLIATSIPRRGVLLREVRDIVTSWINMDFRGRRPARDPEQELYAVLQQVLAIRRLLCDWLRVDSGCRAINLETAATEDGLMTLEQWLGLDLDFTEEMLQPINSTLQRSPGLVLAKWSRWRWDGRNALEPPPGSILV